MKRFALVTLALLAGCKSSSTTPPPPPPTTVACDETTPCVLTSGTAINGDIAAVAQVDVYTLAVTQTTRTLLQISLVSAAPVTPVRFVFLLENSDGSSVLATRGPQTATGAQSLKGIFLVPSAGTYRIIVRDSLNTHADALNGYSLTATLLPDPDTAEPDDTPAQARPLTLTSTLDETMGYIASAGDIDLCSFTVPAPGVLVRWVAMQAASTGPLQLRARLLLRSTTSPNDLTQATSVAEFDATAAGAALAVDVVRSLAAGDYLIAIDDKTGLNGDPTAQWTSGVQLIMDPDPNEQTSRNDTAATATQLSPTGMLQGAIGSQGDVDWYEVQLPESSTAQILTLTLDPMLVDQDLELTWAVGAVIPVPTAACDQSCGPSAFCVNSKCAYTEHANHHFLSMETAPQSVRVRHLGAAAIVRVVVEDFGDLQWSTKLYGLSASLMPDPDGNETTSYNDTIDAGTPVGYSVGVDGGLSFSSEGAIGSWDAIDGLTTAETPADVDWYHLPLPPRVLAPACPPPPACLFPDGGIDDAGIDAGLDGGDAGCEHEDAGFDGGDGGEGLCNPNPLDGGVVYLPRPDYAVALHWRNPADGSYMLGLQGTVQLDAGTACLFSLDQTQAHIDDAGVGYAIGNQLPTDPCFCIAGREADQLWVRTEAAHRSTEPTPALYSNEPYTFQVDLTPGELQLACGDAGCPTHTVSSCPGD